MQDDSLSTPATGLLLTGGGARAAYQVGVLEAIADIRKSVLALALPITVSSLLQRAEGIVAVFLVGGLGVIPMAAVGLGHAAGDEVLRRIASLLRDTARKTDTVARLGGDEFAVLLEEMSGAHDAHIVADRITEALSEVNPMLGMRGVRLGVVLPEIYAMQAQAIFEATVEVGRRGAAVVPEIMIPLVSARREVELVKSHVDAVAATVRIRTGRSFDYKLGVMVETPRAALRAGEIAQHASFLSFGTNDLTQMTYGLSRDDAGRFMNTYVQQGVFPEDPFHILDVDGVGELLLIGADRGRATRPDLTLSICGEHGGNPESIAFCRKAGFDYVSCSPYRVPQARLAAAHLALQDRGKPAEG